MDKKLQMSALVLGLFVLIGAGCTPVVDEVVDTDGMNDTQSGADMDDTMDDAEMDEETESDDMDDSEETNDNEEMNDDEDSEEMDDQEDKDVQASAGTYQKYNESLLANAKDGDVVLFFKADWCPSCVKLDNAITLNSQDIPAGVTILEVDYDDSTELKKKYGVTTQHTLVQVDAEGESINKWTGGSSINDIVEKLK